MINPFSTTRADRRSTAQRLLHKELEQLPDDERQVVERFIERGSVARNIQREVLQSRSLGERVADRVAKIGGSWSFILTFLFGLVVWMVANTFFLLNAFDPYPYILLNLVLSCLAAIQAPIIMMSQNRQSKRDRLDAEIDHEVNVRSELTLYHLNKQIHRIEDKLDAITGQLALSNEPAESISNDKKAHR